MKAYFELFVRAFVVTSGVFAALILWLWVTGLLPVLMRSIDRVNVYRYRN